MNTYLWSCIMHFCSHIFPLSFICLLLTSHSVKATDICDHHIGPLYDPQYSNNTELQVKYYTGTEVVDSYIEGTRYQIYLTSNVSFTQSLVQVRENEVGTIIGSFSFDDDSSSTSFLLHSCNSTNDTMDTFTSNGSILNVILVLWTSPDFIPANNVTIYYSLTRENGNRDDNIKGPTLLVLPTTPTSLALSLISNSLLIPLLLVIILLA